MKQAIAGTRDQRLTVQDWQNRHVQWHTLVVICTPKEDTFETVDRTGQPFFVLLYGELIIMALYRGSEICQLQKEIYQC